MFDDKVRHCSRMQMVEQVQLVSHRNYIAKRIVLEHHTCRGLFLKKAGSSIELVKRYIDRCNHELPISVVPLGDRNPELCYQATLQMRKCTMPLFSHAILSSCRHLRTGVGHPLQTGQN